MSTDSSGGSGDIFTYDDWRDRAAAAGPRFGSEHCAAYQQNICAGYGEDEFCDSCRYVTEFVDWWSHEAEALREFHDVLHGSGTVEPVE